MLSENFHRAFSADDVNQSPDGIIKNVVSVTDRRQTGDDSPRRRIQNDQPGGGSTPDEQPLLEFNLYENTPAGKMRRAFAAGTFTIKRESHDK
jgi:hypothetical protein